MSSFNEKEDRIEAVRPEPESERKSFSWKFAGKLALELLVVFTGVFLASLVDQWKSERTQKANQREVLSLLEEGYRHQVHEVDSSYAGFHQKYSDFLKQYNAGQMPELAFDLSSNGFDSGFWHTMLATGAGNGLDPKLLMQLQFADIGARSLINMSEQTNQLMITILVPNLGMPRLEFYDESTKKLRPKYQWYLDCLAAMDTQFQKLTESTHQRLQAIEEAELRMR